MLTPLQNFLFSNAAAWTSSLPEMHAVECLLKMGFKRCEVHSSKNTSGIVPKRIFVTIPRQSLRGTLWFKAINYKGT